MLAQILDRLERVGGLVSQLGIRFRSAAGEPGCVRMTVGPVHAGAPGVAHGGATMALLDTALGAHAIAHATSRGKVTSTVELKVNFLAPIPLGTELVTETELVSAGRTLMVITGRALDAATGKPVALAQGTFNLFEHPGMLEMLQGGVP